MSLIEQIRISAGESNTDYPKCIVVCTHAKFSTVELCRSLQATGIEVVFYPVSYSKEIENIETLLSLGVTVVEQVNKLIPFIQKADCTIEDGARISKIIRKNNIKIKDTFF